MIRATEKELIALLAELAHGSGSTEGLGETRALWEARLKAKQMNLTKRDLVIAARNLGIKGASNMHKRKLIDEIERVDPDFFAPVLSLIHHV